MKKLFDLKEWLTLEDTAKHLTILFGEEVKESDVLRLALDGHLQLSVNFVNHAKGWWGKIVPLEKAKWVETPLPTLNNKLDNNENVRLMISQRLNKTHVINLDDIVYTLDGIWELAMIGGERISVEDKFQQLIGGPAVDLLCVDGVWVINEFGSVACQLMESVESFKDGPQLGTATTFVEQLTDIHNYYPVDRLPDDCILVVRTSALRVFEDTIRENHKKNNTPVSKSAETKSRNTLLTIIAALAKQSQIDLTKPDAASRIEGCTTRYGRAVTDDTIRKVIAQIDELELPKKPN